MIICGDFNGGSNVKPGDFNVRSSNEPGDFNTGSNNEPEDFNVGLSDEPICFTQIPSTYLIESFPTSLIKYLLARCLLIKL